MWKSLISKLEVTLPRGKPFRRPTGEELAEFEAEHGIRFPPSYVKFINGVGPGYLGGWFGVNAPDFGMDDDWKLRELKLFVDLYKDAEFLGRMIPIGSNLFGDLVAWDPTQVTRRRPLEYRIYVLTRDWPKIVALCDTFPEFVHDVAFGKRLFVALKEKPDPEWKVAYTFHPARPARRKPRYEVRRTIIGAPKTATRKSR